jgi:hypothetical protein
MRTFGDPREIRPAAVARGLLPPSRMIRSVLCAVFVLSACAGSFDGAPCRSQADCGGSASTLGCLGPDARTPCGIGPRHGCASSTDCQTPQVCNAIADSCSDTGFGSECGSTCTATSCGSGFRCNASGACERQPCDEGFTCAPTQRCDATVAHAGGAVWSRTSGCVAISCAKDADCASGQACVNTVCQSGIGTCKKPMLVP